MNIQSSVNNLNPRKRCRKASPGKLIKLTLTHCKKYIIKIWRSFRKVTLWSLFSRKEIFRENANHEIEGYRLQKWNWFDERQNFQDSKLECITFGHFVLTVFQTVISKAVMYRWRQYCKFQFLVWLNLQTIKCYFIYKKAYIDFLFDW